MQAPPSPSLSATAGPSSSDSYSWELDDEDADIIVAPSRTTRHASLSSEDEVYTTAGPSRSEILGSAFSQDDAFLMSAQSQAVKCIKEGKVIPHKIRKSIFKYFYTDRRLHRGERRTLRFPKRVWNDPDSESVLMSEAQVSLFWEQVYALGYLLYDVELPDYVRKNLGLENSRLNENYLKNGERGARDDETGKKDDNNMESTENHEHNGVPQGENEDGSSTPDEWENEDDDDLADVKQRMFAWAQNAIMAWHYFKVERISEVIPLPAPIWQRLFKQPSPEPPSEGSSEQEQQVAACNCPYCWMYTEDLLRFMEHLWYEHGKPFDDAQERKDSGYETAGDDHERQDVEIEDAELLEARLDAAQCSKEARKPMKVVQMISEEDEAGAEVEVGNMDTVMKEVSQEKSNVDTRAPEHKNMVVLLENQDSTDISPMLQPTTKHITAESPSSQSRALLRPSQSPNHRLTIESAQKIRDAIQPFSWYHFEIRKMPRNPWVPLAITNQNASSSSSSSSSSSTTPTSVTETDASLYSPMGKRKRKRSPSTDTDTQHDDEDEVSPTTTPTPKSTPLPRKQHTVDDQFAADFVRDPRYWLCPHEHGECNAGHDSFVTFIEHLGKHGYVVYSKKSDLHKPAPTVSGLATVGWNFAGF